MADVWRDAVPSTTGQHHHTTQVPGCEKYYVPPGTLVYYDLEATKTASLVISSIGAYLPDCNDAAFETISQTNSNYFESEVFFGSVIPIAYSISITTVLAWLLLILLFIAKKRRPWIQKIMMLLVAVALTVSLARVTRTLEQQYDLGYFDTKELRKHLFGSLEFRVFEVLTIFAIWVSHVQVMLHLFQHPRERTVIKVIGALLAIIVVALQCILSFYMPYHVENTTLASGIGVLSDIIYILMQVIYASLVVLYSIRNRAFAYNPQTVTIALITLATTVAPFLFFLLEVIDKMKVVGWAEFLRSGSDAAASIVIWEWIDAIELQQRQQQKSGFLGRQIYEQDLPKDNFISSVESRSSTDYDNGSSADLNLHELTTNRSRWHRMTFSQQSTPANQSQNPNTPMSHIDDASQPSPVPDPSVTPEPPLTASQYRPPSSQLSNRSADFHSPLDIIISPVSSPAESANGTRAVSPTKPSASPLQRHIHPIRRGTKRTNSSISAASSTTSNQPARYDISPLTAEFPLTNITEDAGPKGPSNRIPQNLPQSQVSARNGTSVGSEEAITADMCAQGGFSLDSSGASRPSPPGDEERLPSFEHHPGFSVEDYWTDRKDT